MQQLVCEMCGSSNLVKRDGVFICENCGSQYSVEEAKKMMVEGTVKIDRSDRLSNNYQVARRFINDQNYESAGKYYEMILVDDPNSWEAMYFSVFCRAMTCTIGQIQAAAISLLNCQDTILKLIHENTAKSEQQEAVCQIIKYNASAATFYVENALNSYQDFPEMDELRKRTYTAISVLYVCGDYIEKIFKNQKDIFVLAGSAWKTAIDLHMASLPIAVNENKELETIQSYIEKLDKYNHTAAIELRKTIMQKHLDRLKEKKKSANSLNGIILYVSGIVFVAIAVYFTLYLSFQFGTFDGSMLVFGGLGGLLIYFGKKSKKKNAEDQAAYSQKIEERQKEIDNL